jgi:hypothetical protein
MSGSINPSSIETSVAPHHIHISKAGAVTKGFPGTANAQQVNATVDAKAFHHGQCCQDGSGCLAIASLFKNESIRRTGVNATKPAKALQSMFVGVGGGGTPSRSAIHAARLFAAGITSQNKAIVSVGMNSTSF